MAASGTFDPLHEGTRRRLVRRLECFARRIGVDPARAEDAYSELCVKVLSGKESLLTCEAYFFSAGCNQLRSWRRREVRVEGLETLLYDEDGGSCRFDRVRALGLWVVPEVIGELERRDVRRELGLAQRCYATILRSLPGGHQRAYKARFAERLAALGGEPLVAWFERAFAVDLGPDRGTAALSRRIGRPAGSVACDAHRGQKRLERVLTSERHRGDRGWSAPPPIAGACPASC